MRILVVGLLALSTVPAVAGCSRNRKAEAAEPAAARSVKTETAQLRDVRRQVDVVGTLAAREEVTVSAEVEGRVARLVHDLGDRVNAGDPLVELDPEKLRFKVAEQRAGLDQARARFGAAADGELPPIERMPEVVSAAAQLADAQQQYERAQTLAGRSLLPQSQLDEAKTKVATAKAAHESALAAARQLRAEIAARASTLGFAERELRDAVIRAPFEGYVAERLVTPGQFVGLKEPIMRIVRLHPLKLTAEIPERFAPWIETGRELAVRADAYPGQSFPGKIVRISPSVNLRSRAFAVEGEVPNPDGRLKPGTFARVQITTDHIDRALTVPAAAIQNRYGTNRVFVVNQGQLVGKEVVMGDRVGERVEVLQGLDAGTTIVASDVEQLSEGMKVK
jgi:membrane fusion protein (multidrug efflux system)